MTEMVMHNGVARPITKAELDKMSRLDAYRASRTGEFVRQQRNALLAETDWRFRSDLTPSQEWIDYCQALRDIPQQAGFPDNVTWPKKPE